MELVPNTIAQLADACPAFCLDSYVVLERLGMGGSAVVYKVEHLDTKEVRAIKLSLEPCKALVSDPQQPVQPDAEWKTYRRLNYGLKAAHSAGVPTVYEIGHAKLELALASGTQTHQYMIMELLGGFVEWKGLIHLTRNKPTCRDLDAEIRSRHGMGHVPAFEFQKLALRMLDNLSYLHRAGVVHRDVKPMNYCVPLDDGDFARVYITDFGGFGLSGVKPDAGSVNSTADFVGTIDFASSTALRGLCQGPRDDLEGLLYTLLEISLGTLPWDGDQGADSASLGEMGTQAGRVCVNRCLDTPTRKLRVPQAHSPDLPSGVHLQCLTVMLGAATSTPPNMAACLQLSGEARSGETSHVPVSPGTCMFKKSASQQVLSPAELAIIAAGHEKAWDRWRKGKLLPIWALKWRDAARLLTASEVPNINIFKSLVLSPNFDPRQAPVSPTLCAKRSRNRVKEDVVCAVSPQDNQRAKRRHVSAATDSQHKPEL